MSISRSDIEKLCNYTETNKPSLPNGNIYYIDTLTSKDEWYINQQRRINRQKNINEVLGEENDVADSDWIPFTNDSEMEVMSPRVMSLSAIGRNFTSYEDLREEILQYLDNLTLSPMKTCNQSSLNIQIQKDEKLSNMENMDVISRKILTKITFCSNIIAMNGRIGTANTVVVGSDFFEYLSNSSSFWSNGVLTNGMNIITSDKIKPNKCIVLRGSNQLSAGLCLVKNDDGRFFMKETPNYEKMITWFELI